MITVIEDICSKFEFKEDVDVDPSDEIAENQFVTQIQDQREKETKEIQLIKSRLDTVKKYIQKNIEDIKKEAEDSDKSIVHLLASTDQVSLQKYLKEIVHIMEDILLAKKKGLLIQSKRLARQLFRQMKVFIKEAKSQAQNIMKSRGFHIQSSLFL